MKVVPLQREPPPGPELSDEALMAACSVGDRNALAALFRRHHARIHGFCARMLGDDPDDLVQSTFLVAWRDASRFRGKASVRAWLLGIAANLVRRELRARRHARRAHDTLHAEPLGIAPDPGRQVEDRQRITRLAEAIGRLPVDLREAFVLCTLEGLPGPEAARLLGIRPGTLWRRLHDARKRLLPFVEGEDT